MLALWTARFLPAIREFFGSGLLLRSATYAAIIALVLGAATSVPVRAKQYRVGMISLRWDPDQAADQAQVRNALVLVRESWGAELVVRMWALGISRPDADAIYRGADPCALDSVLVSLDASPLPREAEMLRLNALLADSARLVNAESVTGDPRSGSLRASAIRRAASRRSKPIAADSPCSRRSCSRSASATSTPVTWARGTACSSRNTPTGPSICSSRPPVWSGPSRGPYRLARLR